tara:strand:+ start:538 stop:882 length:345 start_codon:yes stop_codon:yes gene_type:complete
MRDQLLDTLNLKMRNTPLTEGGVHLFQQGFHLNLPYITLSLIDRGLADTRAIAIGKALEKGDISGLSRAILECDSYNFPLLVKLEPRLFEMLLKDGGIEGDHPALIERLNEVMK